VKAVVAMSASKPMRTLASGAQDWNNGTGDEGVAMARSDVDGKEAEIKGSEVGGRCLFKAEAR
jgi:hypothetical protein